MSWFNRHRTPKEIAVPPKGWKKSKADEVDDEPVSPGWDSAKQTVGSPSADPENYLDEVEAQRDVKEAKAEVNGDKGTVDIVTALLVVFIIIVILVVFGFINVR